MSRELLAQDSVEGTLECITTSAAALVEGCEAAGVLVLNGQRVHSHAPTNVLVVQSDMLQEAVQEGPCFDASRNGEPVYRLADFAEGSGRWPRFAPRARDLGIGSMMGFLLYTEEQQLGSLNLYSHRPGAFTDDSETAGWALASHAAVALAGARTTQQFQQAMDSRNTIGAAMGIIMERFHLTEAKAFDTLRTLSQERNIKMRDLARQIADSGDIER
ncbi:GAF and ANTAR domain-containing protein [Streptomyces fuscigenes]|uniref:GAF and ANTAR domain-containing protein n=1 Tax=Streptomyces fuscigenes TaxID=1528880 RepID=UPI001F377C59|nr:GAF and ANTAR domain-containing protein [Streptomyces fuscigenes]MCF3960450.1 GAF and ANTAR domain-containing protein [Streptomyces fuscigenes]